MGTREVLLSAVIPAVASVVVLLLVHFVLGRSARRALGEGDGLPLDRGASALGVAFVVLATFGVVLGSYAWQSRVDLWADSVTHRFPAIAGVGLVVGLLGVVTPVRRSALGGAVCATVGGGVVAWMVVGALHESLISEAARWGWIAGIGLIAGAQAWAMGRGVRALPGWRGPAVVWLVTGIVALGATAGLANAPLVLWPVSAAAFGLAVIGMLRRETDLLAGATPAIAVLLVGTLAMSNWFGDRERWLMFGLLSASPVAIGLAAALLRKPVWIRLVVVGGVSVGLAGAQAGLSVPALIEASTGSDDPYEY